MTGIDVRITDAGSHPSLLGDATCMRVETDAGHRATAHVARWPLLTCRVRLVHLDPPRTVQQWCMEQGVAEACNGGFFTKPDARPLGELVVDGRAKTYQPFVQPWRDRRGAIQLADHGTRVCIAPRAQLARPTGGSLLQAGPLLVEAGRSVVARKDPEGFSTTSHEFDSDITAEPLPRQAIGLTAARHLLAVTVDGRGDEDDGLLLDELAALMVKLGAASALNLDGGSSAAIVTAGQRRNVPRDDSGVELVDGYPTASLLAVEAR